MSFLFVDLAERHSAAVLVDYDGEVIGQATNDSGVLSRPSTVTEIVQQGVSIQDWVFDGSMTPLVADVKLVRIAVEDVNTWSVNPKPATRAQAYLLWALYLVTLNPSKTVLVRAIDWQKWHGYKKQKGVSTKGWAKALCTEKGFIPEADTPKQKEDLRDAYLGALWLRAKELKIPKPEDGGSSPTTPSTTL